MHNTEIAENFSLPYGARGKYLCISFSNQNMIIGADKNGKSPDGETYIQCAETDDMKALLSKKQDEISPCKKAHLRALCEYNQLHLISRTGKLLVYI
ncbi:hypothetical protein MAR_009267 [Mya arenaria]|uniref:Uncharacterized protein n=1 Tax=Mya arenaria TaxID=6604 RepID=A0ABY7E0C6_MYAAR|nr:hypothetical protein MAR_009267 [Mya arenaria]